MKEIKDCSGKDGKYNFHEQCLSCCRCHGAAGNEELMTLEDGNLICSRCNGAQTKNCTKCKMTIEEKSLRFNSKHYHPECFVCGQCGQPLSGREIYRHINGNFCESCWGGARGF